VAKAAPAQQRESAADRQARIEAAWIATGKKRLLHSSHEAEKLEKDKHGLRHALGHDIDGGRVEQWEKDRRAVFQALGHDADRKCPAGVDWRIMRNNQVSGARAGFAGMSEAAKAATWNAYRRALCHFNTRGKWPETFAPCGWWFCGKQLKAPQWSELARAVKILKAKDIDPRDYIAPAGTYAESVALAKQWPKHKSLWNSVHEIKKSLPSLERATLSPQDAQRLRAMDESRWAVFPRDGKGRRVDAPYQRFLNCNDRPPVNWTAQVAAAVFFLLGLGEKGASLKDEIHRAEVEWTRGGKLNLRR
jgi:hypothetical protein